MFFPRLAVLTVIAAMAAFSADPALLRLVSPDAKVVGGVNMVRAVSSPLGQIVVAKMNAEDAGFREFVTSTGFDPRKDLRDVVFAASGEMPGNHSGVVVARGVFNGPQILAAAKAKGAATTTYRGVEMLSHNDGALAVIDGSLLIAGRDADVKAAIDRRAQSASPTSPVLVKAGTLMNRYDAWMVSTAPVGRFPTHGPNQQSPVPLNPNVMQGILETSGGMVLDTVVTIDGEAVTRSDKDAQALVDVAKFLSSFMQMNQQNQPNSQVLQNILNTLQVRSEGSTVKFTLRAPVSDIEQLLNTPKRATHRAARR